MKIRLEMLVPAMIAIGVSVAATALDSVNLTLVDPDATGYGTFQSHNARVVSNNHGIFLTYLHWYVDPDCTWRMDRSTDGGTSFQTIYQRDQHDTSHTPPAIETDEDDNVYLAFADAIENTFHFIRFFASEEYATAHETTIDYAPCAAKYTMVYDQPRQRFHIGLQYGGLVSIGRDGKVIDAYHQVYTHGGVPDIKSTPQYPHLHLDATGTLYYAHTTADVGDVPFSRIYRSILCLKSPDAGAIWQRLDGAAVTTPVRSDEDGDATVVTEPVDLTQNSWLGSTLTKAGRTHFWWSRRVDGQPIVTPYVSYDVATGERRSIDLGTVNTTVKFQGGDGFFATRDLGAQSCLYVISTDAENRVVSLYSPDNGLSWFDHARGENANPPYAVSGSQRVSDDGYILGAYTEKSGPDGHDQIWFFKIKASPDETTAPLATQPQS